MQNIERRVLREARAMTRRQVLTKTIRLARLEPLLASPVGENVMSAKI
jgi:hypothetical protein